MNRALQKIRHHMSDIFEALNPNKALFHHGRSRTGPRHDDYLDAVTEAYKIANHNDYKCEILRMCIANNPDLFEGKLDCEIIEYEGNMYGPNVIPPMPYKQRRFLDACSIPYAANAKGDIYCVEGTVPRPNKTPEKLNPGIYRNIELPIMMLMKQVDSITKINPATKTRGRPISLRDEWDRMHRQGEKGEMREMHTEQEIEKILLDKVGNDPLIKEFVDHFLNVTLVERREELKKENAEQEQSQEYPLEYPQEQEQHITDIIQKMSPAEKEHYEKVKQMPPDKRDPVDINKYDWLKTPQLKNDDAMREQQGYKPYDPESRNLEQLKKISCGLEHSTD